MSLVATLRDYNARINMLVGRCSIHAVESADYTQRLQIGVMSVALYQDVEHYEPYGMTARALPGARGCAVATGGEADLIFVTTIHDARHRPRGLPPGGTMLYSFENGPEPGLAGRHGLTLLPEGRRVDGRGGAITLRADDELRLEVGATQLILTDGRLLIRAAEVVIEQPGEVETDATVLRGASAAAAAFCPECEAGQ